MCQTEVDFVEASETIIQNGIDYGEFKQIGTYEQGGVMCPKCGYSNNSYTFEGICQKCGYTKNESIIFCGGDLDIYSH